MNEESEIFFAEMQILIENKEKQGKDDEEEIMEIQWNLKETQRNQWKHILMRQVLYFYFIILLFY